MREYYLGFKFMISYFTILPVRFTKSDNLSTPKVLASMVMFLPIGGALLGFLTLGVYQLFGSLEWLGAIISALFYMMLYGFIHAEAVIDVADAIYASHSGKDAYSIIKDPTVGAMGVLWGVAILLLKVATISYILLHGLGVWMVVVLTISRLGLLLLISTHRFRSTFISTLQKSLDYTRVVVAMILYTLLIYLATSSIYSVALVVSGLLLSVVIAYLIRRAIGFVNGDVLGSVLEVVEIVLFVVVARVYI